MRPEWGGGSPILPWCISRKGGPAIPPEFVASPIAKRSGARSKPCPVGSSRAMASSSCCSGTAAALEAFQYARTEVEKYYAGKNLLQTEHALLDDNGDGRGSADPGTRDDGD